MTEANYEKIAETLRDEYNVDTSARRVESVGFAIDVYGTDDILGRRLAKRVLEEHNAVLIKGHDYDDYNRLWFDTLKEREVTETVTSI